MLDYFKELRTGHPDVPEMVIKLGTRKNNKIFAKNKNDKIKDLLYINLCQTVDLTFAQWLNLYA